ncbi:hypothetical protein [Flavobacterium johnsoniae]|uniref:hypothetical protein n=1 Tax=Flavobacterium johnsoniae TaxID=986 RepID=UPI0005C4E3F3|nr:hypothetical protein [Flavobacterium johnsoniae]OXE97124.1 hypothetical protein B0A63_19390 [Flavobacterium johnsoniae UW101]WQG79619.1 hypothetical protein SR927_16505 [Flavobacterium johnsoniae UW101]SHL72784.1 hypothetical protein SAMN05444146_4380 [Flavobacterium johnsoniae]
MNDYETNLSIIKMIFNELEIIKLSQNAKTTNIDFSNAKLKKVIFLVLNSKTIKLKEKNNVKHKESN